MPKNLFKDILKNEESLFINEMALDPEYIPELIPYRENETKYLATCIKPLLQGRAGKNLFITGTPGIGKTVAVKFIFRELENETENIIPIYINCWKKDTAYKIVLEICNQLNYKWIQNRKTDELLKEITKILNKKSVVFCFDEIDKLEDHSIIYQILEDVYKKSIFLITNKKEWIKELDPRIKSRLTPELLEFRPYSYDETAGILKERVEYAFAPNIFEKEAFELIAQKTFESADIRTGLFLLKESGNLAENESSKRILTKHTSDAVKKIKDLKIKSSNDLKDEEKEILKLVKDNSGKTIKELYNIYVKKIGKKAYSTFHKKIKELENAERISTKEINRGQKGKSTLVKYGRTKRLNEF